MGDRPIAGNNSLVQEAAIPLLATYGSKSKVARMLGISRYTLIRWEKKPHFQEKLYAYKMKWKEQTIDKFQHAAPEVADALVRKALEGDVQAARAIYNRIGLPETSRIEHETPQTKERALALFEELTRRFDDIRKRLLEEGTEEEPDDPLDP